MRTPPLVAIASILALLAPAVGSQHARYMGSPWEEPAVYYDPEDAPKRGGRWRALARWRSWWDRERRPATRRTSRRRA